LTQTSLEADLLTLRDAVTQLGRAIAVSDLALVESSTAQIKLLVDRANAGGETARASQRALIEELEAASQEIETLLASRLRAFDIAIAAWRATDPGL
jgi:hypothetical protein